jgi:uncharacterized Fe-S cluster-containing radical SAM superfamily enzyme
MNDEELKGLVEIGKKVKSVKSTKSAKSEFPVLGIQNYLNYKRGRNPVKQRNWEEFFEMLKPFEKASGLKLRLCKEDFGIKHDAKLEKPFDKKQIVKARMVCEGPLKGEKIGVYKNRAIIIEKADKATINSVANVKIIRSKHNIYRAVL